MPVNVPKKPKKYTTVYDNFKGVDLTNDPSNVYKRRSPNGMNMMPDIDGRPYKRKGWTIEHPYTDFLTAAESSANSFTPKRIHHFSIGGEDYMMFFNSLGVFYTSETTHDIVKAQLASGDEEDPDLEDFPPTVDDVPIEADSGRSFFFEGEGTAGFYTFVGSRLFRFDGRYYWEVEPYIPLVLIACDRYGTGQKYEGINLLTRMRTVGYQCDDLKSGGTVAERSLVVPGGVKDNEAKVEILVTSGDWIEIGPINNLYPYSIGEGKITFADECPPVTVKGEDNLRVTYASAGGYVVIHTDEETHETTTTEEHTGTRTATGMSAASCWFYRVRTRSVKYYPATGAYEYGSWSAYGPYQLSGDSYDDASRSAVISISNLANESSIVISPAPSTRNWGAYGSYMYAVYTASQFSSPSSITNVSEGGLINNIGSTVYGSGATRYQTGTQSQSEFSKHNLIVNYSYQQYYTYSTTSTSSSTSYIEGLDYVEGDGEYITPDASAFTACQRASVYGSGLVNQVFLCASTYPGFNSRMWYSGVQKPNYFPDLNYVEVGSNDTSIMGLLKCDEYLGVIKAGNALDSSIYLAYPTSFDDDTTYAVKQSIAGIGAVSTGAFNILSEEPVFLSKRGVMGIELGDEKRLRSRSHFLNGKLKKEPNLQDAISYVFDGMYFLSTNNRCYVLDGSQKSSWANEKTNLQYEGYILDNIPAQCFADMGGKLYFTDSLGNVCRFLTENDPAPYRDAYSVYPPDISTPTAPVNGVYQKSDLTGDLKIGKTIRNIDNWYTIVDIGDETVQVTPGVPIKAVWSTIADDDGAVHFFKNLQKKGCLVSLLPGTDTGVDVYIKPDEKEPVFIGKANASKEKTLPTEFYIKKKIKKYKRLQIICRNDNLDEGFGIDEIIKNYTIGNYSKNRG